MAAEHLLVGRQARNLAVFSSRTAPILENPSFSRNRVRSAPTLVRIETKASHGAGKPTTKVIEEAADVLAFLTKVLELTP